MQAKELPVGVVEEKLAFIPRMAMTDELRLVAGQIIHQWRHRQKFAGLSKYGIRPLDRLLFYGPPGNGKTVSCYWIAKQLGIPVYRVLCNNLHGTCLGQTSGAVGDVMDFFSNRAEPALVLWDEVESIFTNRSNMGSSGSQRELGTALTVFMQALDRWRSPILLVMATNLVDELDTALLSRVELQLEFRGPSVDQCREVINYWRELLNDNGSEEWGPILLERFKENPADSFRVLQQSVAFAARDWIAKQCG